MSDQYKPKGITPLPYKVVGPDNGWGNSIAILSEKDLDGPWIACDYGTEQWAANARYLTHAANQYPKAIAELNRALAVIRCPQAFEIEDVCADIQAVLNKAKELEADADTGERK